MQEASNSNDEDSCNNFSAAIDLPEEQEFLDIIKQAVMEESKLYEPFSLLEKRVMHSICYGGVKIKKELEEEEKAKE